MIKQADINIKAVVTATIKATMYRFDYPQTVTVKDIVKDNNWDSLELDVNAHLKWMGIDDRVTKYDIAQNLWNVSSEQLDSLLIDK